VSRNKRELLTAPSALRKPYGGKLQLKTFNPQLSTVNRYQWQPAQRLHFTTPPPPPVNFRNDQGVHLGPYRPSQSTA
jgi:hypothetical protein